MSTKTIRLALATLAAVGVGVVSAQEMGEDAKPESKVPTTVVEEVEADGDSDEGPQIVAEASSKQKELASESAAPAKSTFVPAEEQVQDTIEKKMKLEFGYLSERKSIIAQGTAYATVKDPANDETFMALRSSKAVEAYLIAKSAIIGAICSEVSAYDRATVMAKHGESKVEKVFAQKQAEFAAKRDEFQKKLALLDDAEAEALAGVTMNDRFGAILDGIAKKINKEYDPEKITAEKRAKVEALRAECAVLKAEFDALQEEAENLPTVPKNEIESGITMLSKMPLIGSSVLTQAESWDESTKQYSVSMALVWSPKLQEAAEKLVVGNFEPSKETGNLTRKEWIDMQDISAMVGPRRFMDKNGHSYFIGIAGQDMTCKASDINGRKFMAEANARKAVVFSLVGDAMVYEDYKSHLKEYESKSDDLRTLVENLRRTMEQKADIQLQGCLPLRQRTVKHPISGRKTYVAVMYVDPMLANDAAEILKSNYAADNIISTAVQYKRGVKAGFEEEQKNVRASKAAFNRGVSDGKNAVKAEEKDQAVRVLPKKSPKAVSAGASGSGASPIKTPGKSKGGSFSGDAAIDTNF